MNIPATLIILGAYAWGMHDIGVGYDRPAFYCFLVVMFMMLFSCRTGE